MNSYRNMVHPLISLRPGTRAERNKTTQQLRFASIRRGRAGIPCAGLPSTLLTHGTKTAAVTLLLLAAAVALTLAGDGKSAHAQSAGAGVTERVLISNLGEAQADDSTTLATSDAEIRFQTGQHDPGYTISRVELKFTGPASSASDLPIVALRNHVDTEAILTGSPTDLGGNTYAFTVDPPIRVAKASQYRLLIEGGPLSLAQTDSDAVQTGTTHVWRTDANGFARSHDSTGSTSGLISGNSFMFTIRGHVVQPALAYVSNIGQITAEHLTLRGNQRAQPFTTGSDAAGYPVHSVSVATQDATSTLQGQAIKAATTLSIHRDSPDGPKVTDLTSPLSVWVDEYVLDTPVTLAASTMYWVVAAAGRGDWMSTGTDQDSGSAAGWSIGDKHEFRTKGNPRAFTQIPGTGALKISINGAGSNSVASGKPAITTSTAFRVPAMLSVDFSGITDTDGLADIGPSVTYRWQRFDAAGTTLDQDNIGSDAAYTLTDDDAGKTIKVAVSFEDDSGFAEGPLTSDATTAITAVGECPAPDLQGGAALIEGPRKIGVAQYTINLVQHHGYRDVGSSQAGTLDNNTFATTTNRSGYTIDAFEMIGTELYFRLTSDLSAADKQALMLHVCGDDYPLSDFTLGSASTYFITSAQDWSRHAQLTFYISEDLVDPTFADATVDGTSLMVTFDENLRQASSLQTNRFAVTKGTNDDTVAFASGSPTITGNTVALTLSSAIAETDTNIKVSYTKPTTGSNNRVADLVGREAASFSGREVVNVPADSVVPTLASINPAVVSADGKTLTLTMTEAMKTTSLPSAAAFTVKATPDGSSEAAVALDTMNPVTVTGSAVALNFAMGIAHNDTNVKVSYAAPTTGGKLQDRAGNALASFADQAVTNNSTVPRVSIRAIYPDVSPVIAFPWFEFKASTASSEEIKLSLELEQTEDYFSVHTDPEPKIAAQATSAEARTISFKDEINSINTDGTATVTLVAGDGYVPALAPNNSATMQVKLPPTGPSVWVSHRQLEYDATEGEPFSVGVVFNAGAGVAQPRQHHRLKDAISVALLTEDSGTASINQDYIHISRNIVVTPEHWSSTQAGGYTYTHEESITIIDDGVYEPDVETFTAFLGRSQGVVTELVVPDREPTGTATIRITNVNPLRGITGIAVSSTPTGSYYGVSDAITFTVTFNGSVTVDTTNGTPQFAFDIAGQTRQAAYTSGSDSTDLVFSYTVMSSDPDDPDGISWAANSLSLNGGTIKLTSNDVADQVDAERDHTAQGPLSDHKVDTQKPTLQTAAVDGDMLSLTYSEELNTTAPANSVFTVTVDGGAGANPTNVSINGKVVTLTLGTTVDAGQTVTLTYAKPASDANPVEDLSGREADGFINESVSTQAPVDVTVSFAQASHTVAEGDTVDVTVTLSADPERTVVIPVEATAQNGASTGDYTVAASLTFNRGETQKSLTFAATDDPVDDEGERVRLTFGTLPAAVSQGSPNQTTVDITDNDDPLTVQNITVTSTSTGSYYGVSDAITFTVTFNGSVTVDTTNGTPQFAFDIAGQTRQAAYTSGSDSTDLVFSYTVMSSDPDDPDGISWAANSLSLNGGTIKLTSNDVADQVDAERDHTAQGPLSDHKVDTQKPTLQTAAVDGDMLSLTYSEELNTTAPANSVFTVTVDGGAGANPTNVSINGKVVTLTLGTTVDAGQTVTLTYAKPASDANPVEDLSGREADGFINESVASAARVQETLSGDPNPSQVRELREVVRSNSLVQLYFRAPERSGHAALRGYEYRYAAGETVPTHTSWRTASSRQVEDRVIFVSELAGDTLYTFEVRAVNRIDKRGAPASVQATTSAAPGTTQPSAPASVAATAGEPYTELDSIDGLPARVAFVDATVQFAPATDHGNAVIHYVYRIVEGNRVPSSTPWEFGNSYLDDELALTVSLLKPGTSYTLEMAAQAQDGTTGTATAIRFTTPVFTGPHYTLSAPNLANEDETFTITVSRTNRNDGESTAIVEIRGPGERDVSHRAAEFGSDDISATVTYSVEDDGQTTTGRSIRVRVGAVGPRTDHTYSVEWHTVEIRNITTQ